MTFSLSASPSTAADVLAQLTTTCPHCGQRLLTVVGEFVALDPTDKRYRATIGLKRVCDCPAAKRTQADEKAAEMAKECEKKAKEAQATATKRAKAAGIPENWLSERSLSRWAQDHPCRVEAYERAVAFGMGMATKTTPRSLYIAGDVGTGKTFLASCLCCDLIRRGHRLLWRNVSDVLRAIRAAFDDRKIKEADVIASFIKPRVLVLDDLGKERPTEWALEQLFSIINARYDARLPLIVTTNYGSADLVRRLTPRADASGYADDTTAHAIVDRLRGTSQLIKLEGRSRR